MAGRDAIPDRLARVAWQALEHERADDDEAALNELIAELSGPVEEEGPSPQEFVRRDEFVCRSCHLVLHRSGLADRGRMACTACVWAGEKAGAR